MKWITYKTHFIADASFELSGACLGGVMVIQCGSWLAGMVDTMGIDIRLGNFVESVWSGYSVGLDFDIYSTTGELHGPVFRAPSVTHVVGHSGPEGFVPLFYVTNVTPIILVAPNRSAVFFINCHGKSILLPLQLVTSGVGSVSVTNKCVLHSHPLMLMLITKSDICP